MKRREFISLVGAAAAWPLAAEAQEVERARRVGVLIGYDENDLDAKAWLSGFMRGLTPPQRPRATLWFFVSFHLLVIRPLFLVRLLFKTLPHRGRLSTAAQVVARPLALPLRCFTVRSIQPGARQPRSSPGRMFPTASASGGRGGDR
jgi:hypothetical protein